MFALSVERAAEKDLGKLPSIYFPKIVSRIKELSYEPYPKGCKKLISTENFWRIRIGNYRVIYEVIESDNVIRIYKIKHRKDVYKS